MLHTKRIFGTLNVLMRKTLSILIFLVLPMVIAAQTRTVNINWEGSTSDQTKPYLPQASSNLKESSSDVLKLELGPGAPIYTTQWEDSNFADKSSLKVSNVGYGHLSSEE